TAAPSSRRERAPAPPSSPGAPRMATATALPATETPATEGPSSASARVSSGAMRLVSPLSQRMGVAAKAGEDETEQAPWAGQDEGLADLAEDARLGQGRRGHAEAGPLARPGRDARDRRARALRALAHVVTGGAMQRDGRLRPRPQRIERQRLVRSTDRHDAR